jgi:hypothetical protein
MKTQHTPGPWEISKIGNDYDQHSIYAGDALVANSVEGEANARLIASAPELLEALKKSKYVLLVTQAYFAINGHDERRDQIKRLFDLVHEAVDKAEG